MWVSPVLRFGPTWYREPAEWAGVWGDMPSQARSVTFEVMSDGVVQDVIRFERGSWFVGDERHLLVTVGPGGCWVEGHVSLLRVNGVRHECVELHPGDLVTFGLLTLRAWPSLEPAKPLRPIASGPALGSPSRGLHLELWWSGQPVREADVWKDQARLPAAVAGIEEYETVAAPVARRRGRGFEFYVPPGCEASEPLNEARFAVVPTFRPLVIARGALELRVSQAASVTPPRARRLVAALAALAAVVVFSAFTASATFQRPLRHTWLLGSPRRVVSQPQSRQSRPVTGQLEQPSGPGL